MLSSFSLEILLSKSFFQFTVSYKFQVLTLAVLIHHSLVAAVTSSRHFYIHSLGHMTGVNSSSGVESRLNVVNSPTLGMKNNIPYLVLNDHKV